jgi:DNA-binding response OmpR family regulator
MKVVVVEQDVAMRTLIAEWLQADGNDVRTLGSQDGLHGVEEDVDLAVVDLSDLRSSGAARVRALRQHFPRAATIGMSTALGRSLGPASALVRQLGVQHLLAKPCSHDELRRAVAASRHATHPQAAPR